MSLPPVEEVARITRDRKINEKKPERLRKFGGGSKREWWVVNMKGETRKQRSVSSEPARMLVEVNGKNHQRWRYSTAEHMKDLVHMNN